MRGKIEEIEAALGVKERGKWDFSVGDTVEVHYKVREADRERAAPPFEGIVIAVRGVGASRSFNVRSVVGGEAVERIFPAASPAITKIAVKKRGRVRRSKLYYLRAAKGKRARIEEVFVAKSEQQAAPKPETKPETKRSEKPEPPQK